jgi:two-component system sensor histidine kinase/response regulator
VTTRDPGTAETTETRPGGTTATAPRRVLVVDDDELNRRVAAEQCVRLGLVAETAADGREALAALADRPFDLILLDDRLPGMDGSAVVRELRRREAAGGLSRLPVIGVTASVLPEDGDRLLAAGMDAYLAKPLMPAELAEIVARLAPSDGPRRSRPVLARQ